MSQLFVFKYNQETGHYEAVAVDRPPPGTREVPFHIKNDEMPGAWHPASDRYFTSKAKFRAETKAYGFEEKGDQRYAPRQEEKGYAKEIDAIKGALWEHGLGD